MAPELPADGDCLGGARGAAESGGSCSAPAPRSGSTRCCAATTSRSWSGEGSNVQDGCVCHTDVGFPLTIGAGCTIGHMAMLHGCTIGDDSLVGMGATVLNGAVIGRSVLVGAGALVTEGKEIPGRRAGGRAAGEGGARPDGGGDRRAAPVGGGLPRQYGDGSGRGLRPSGRSAMMPDLDRAFAEARRQPLARRRRAPGAGARTARRRA